MKNILLILLFTCFSGFALAEVTLNKTTAQQYFNATKSLDMFEDDHPEIMDSFGGSDFLNKSKFIAQIKSIPQFTSIEKNIKAAGFADFETFYDISIKITGGMMAMQMEKMPERITSEKVFLAQEQMIEKMKSSNVPREHIDEMIKNMDAQKSNMNNMIKLAESTSEQDKVFVRDNAQWVMENMMQHDNENEEEY